MISTRLVGETSFDSKIFYLKADRAWEIVAPRIFICTHSKPKEAKEELKDVEEVIDWVNEKSEEAKNYVKRIQQYQHGDMGEMGYDAYYFKDVSRRFTFNLWTPIGAPRGIKGVGSELSLRRVKAMRFLERGLSKLNEKAMKIYELLQKEIPIEEARCVLNLNIKTEVILQIPPGRDVDKLANHLLRQPFEEEKQIGEMLKNWNLDKTEFSLPQPELVESNVPLMEDDEPSHRKFLRNYLNSWRAKPNLCYLYDPYSETLSYLVQYPMFAAHQDMRNRQAYFYPSSWENFCCSELGYWYPKNLSDRTKEKVEKYYSRVYDQSLKFWERGDYERATYVQPLGRKIEMIAIIHGNENIRYTIENRACLRAQRPIREIYETFARKIIQLENLGPRCITRKACYEYKREQCPRYKNLSQKNKH